MKVVKLYDIADKYFRYIDNTLPIEKRQSLLQQRYDFQCKCSKCIREGTKRVMTRSNPCATQSPRYINDKAFFEAITCSNIIKPVTALRRQLDLAGEN